MGNEKGDSLKAVALVPTCREGRRGLDESYAARLPRTLERVKWDCFDGSFSSIAAAIPSNAIGQAARMPSSAMIPNMIHDIRIIQRELPANFEA